MLKNYYWAKLNKTVYLTYLLFFTNHYPFKLNIQAGVLSAFLTMQFPKKIDELYNFHREWSRTMGSNSGAIARQHKFWLCNARQQSNENGKHSNSRKPFFSGLSTAFLNSIFSDFDIILRSLKLVVAWSRWRATEHWK